MGTTILDIVIRWLASYPFAWVSGVVLRLPFMVCFGSTSDVFQGCCLPAAGKNETWTILQHLPGEYSSEPVEVFCNWF